MKVGLQINKFTWDGGDAAIRETLTKIAQSAEDAGFDSVWVMDHFFQLDPMLGSAEEPMLEGYTTLGFLAGVTERVQLGTLVTGIHYRHPGELIKEVTTLDVVSGGRAYFGVGAGWYERESKGLGFPFPPLKERFEWLEDTLKLTHHMWKGNKDAFHGTHVNAAEPISSPQPVAKPHPPIMIGGGGEKKTLRFVAEYGDACNLISRGGVDPLKDKLDVLKKHCEDVGRDYAEIEKTILYFADVSNAASMIEYAQKMKEIGVDHIIYGVPGVETLECFETFKNDIIPALKQL